LGEFENRDLAKKGLTPVCWRYKLFCCWIIVLNTRRQWNSDQVNILM